MSATYRNEPLKDQSIQQQNLFTTLMSIQLILVVFQPPVALGNYKFYFSDFWMIISLVVMFIKFRKNLLTEKIKKIFTYSATLMTIIWIHGASRVSLIDDFASKNMHILTDDRFNFIKELWNMLRYLSWFWAFTLVTQFPKLIDLSKIKKISEYLFIFILFSLCAYTVSPAMQKAYGKIYQYDPGYFDWRGRAQGVFASPVEAGIATLMLGLLLISTSDFRKQIQNALVFAGIFVSILLTRSGTALISILLSASSILILNRKKFPKVFIYGWFAFWSGAIVFLAINFNTIWENNPALRGKILNLLWRFGPWEVYLHSALKRIDLLLLGYGFTPYHADNSFLFTLNRGGVLTLTALIYIFYSFVKQQKIKWNILQQHFAFFFLISCFTVDLLIYRHTVAILIAFGIPYLVSRSEVA